jgi:hypothetical protein
LIQFVRTNRTKRSELDYLIVLLHEGVQHYPLPTPELQKRCRFIIEEGADAVICQHSHISGCYEIYQARPIIYGQGDFISDGKSSLKDDSGFLVKLMLDEKVQIQVVPFLQQEAGGVRRMTSNEEQDFRIKLELRNNVLENQQLLELEWRNHCKVVRDSYYAQIKGYNRPLKFLNRKLHWIEQIDVYQAAELLNLFRCQAHREAIEMIFSSIIEKQSSQGR